MEKEIDVFMLCPNCKKITNGAIDSNQRLETEELYVRCKICNKEEVCTDRFSDVSKIDYSLLSNEEKRLYIPRHISDYLHKNAVANTNSAV